MKCCTFTSTRSFIKQRLGYCGDFTYRQGHFNILEYGCICHATFTLFIGRVFLYWFCFIIFISPFLYPIYNFPMHTNTQIYTYMFVCIYATVTSSTHSEVFSLNKVYWVLYFTSGKKKKSVTSLKRCSSIVINFASFLKTESIQKQTKQESFSIHQGIWTKAN